MIGIELDIRTVDRGRVFVAQFAEIKLAKIAIDLVSVLPVPVGEEILIDDFGASEIRKTQAYYAKRIGEAMFVFFLIIAAEVEARLEPMIEHCHVSVQGILIQFLLVEGPAELIQG